MVGLTTLFIALSVGILLCIGHIQATYSVDRRVINLFRPRPDRYVEEPKRGRILAEDGRPLAITAPLYDIYMDCTVRKSEFEEMDRKEARRIERLKKEGKDAPAPQYKGAAAEKLWKAKADTLSRELARLFPAKSADQYYSDIISGRENGKKHVLPADAEDAPPLPGRRLQGRPHRRGARRAHLPVRHPRPPRHRLRPRAEPHRHRGHLRLRTPRHGRRRMAPRHRRPQVYPRLRQHHGEGRGRQRCPHHPEHRLPGHRRPGPPRPDRRRPADPGRHRRPDGGGDGRHPRDGEPLPRHHPGLQALGTGQPRPQGSGRAGIRHENRHAPVPGRGRART